MADIKKLGKVTEENFIEAMDDLKRLLTGCIGILVDSINRAKTSFTSSNPAKILASIDEATKALKSPLEGVNEAEKIHRKAAPTAHTPNPGSHHSYRPR